jgi:hypothetical protein
VLEVKDYPGSHVPYAEFTAITNNLATNVADLTQRILPAEIDKLSLAGKTDAARALQRAVDAVDVQVEIWLGPGTLMGKEALPNSVLGRLRGAVQIPGDNVRLAPGPPRQVTSTNQRAAVAARLAAAKRKKA